MVSFLSQRGYFLAKGTILKHAVDFNRASSQERKFQSHDLLGSFLLSCVDVTHLQFLGGTVL